MKSDELRKAIGEIDDALIDEAEKTPPEKQKRNVFYKWTAAAASFIIVLAVLFTVNYSVKHKPSTGEIEPSQTADRNPSAKDLYTATSSAGISDIPVKPDPGEEWKTLQDWDKLLIYEKYTSLYIYGTVYSPLGPDYGHTLSVGEMLFENAKLNGQRGDEIKETIADVYRIEKILPSCMVKVVFADGTDCIYFCRDYYPETLGDLINDAYFDVSLNAEYGNTPTVFDENGKIVEEQKWYRVYTDDVLSFLKQNKDIKNGADRNGKNEMYDEKVIITVGIKVASYGYPFSMWITESGYLRMNVFNKYSFFYVGKENAKAFADLIFKREAMIPETMASIPETTEIPE